MALVETTSKKRKRENDIPRITYYAGDRTFERLFKEESLSETLDVVRRKLGIDDKTRISLSQIRGNQIIDLDDDDDFEAFQSFAYETMAMSVRVQMKESTRSQTRSMSAEDPGQATHAPATQAPPQPALPPPPTEDVTAIAASNSSLPAPPPAPSGDAKTQEVVPQRVVEKQAVVEQAASNATDPSEDMELPVAKRRKRETTKPAISRAKRSGNPYPSVAETPVSGTESQPTANQSAPATASSLSVQDLPESGDPVSIPLKRRKQSMVVDHEAIVAPHKASRGDFDPPSAAIGKKSAPPPSTPAEIDAAPEKVKKKKKAPEVPVVEALQATDEAPSHSNATTAESKIKRPRRTHKSRATVEEEEVPNLALSAEVPSTSLSAPPIEGSAANPPKKVKKASKKATEPIVDKQDSRQDPPLPTGQPVLDNAHDDAPSQASSRPPVRKSKRKSQASSPSVEARVIASNATPGSIDTGPPADSPAAGKPRRFGLATIKCPICLKTPYHIRLKCPIVQAGPEVLEPRLQELRQEGLHKSVVKDLEAILAKLLATKSTDGENVKSSPMLNHGKQSPSKAPPPSSKRSAPANGHVGSSVGSSDKPKRTTAIPRAPISSKNLLTNFGKILDSRDISSIDAEALLRGPDASRITIDDIESVSESEEASSNDDILEEDRDYDGPCTRSRMKRVVVSSDDDSEAAMDVDSLGSVLVDIPFGAVDRLGQSQEMDRRPDQALDQPSRPGSIMPDVRTSLNDESQGTRKGVDAALQTASGSQVEPRVSGENPSTATTGAESHSLNGVRPVPRAELSTNVAQTDTPSTQSKPPRTRNTKDIRSKPSPRQEIGAANPKTLKAPKSVRSKPTGGETHSLTTKPINGEKAAKARKNADKALAPLSPPVVEGQSLVQWETLPVSESPPLDRSSQALDELDGHESELPTTSTPLPGAASKPLFLPTDSQFPTFSQTQSTQLDTRSLAESDEEAEVENTIKRNLSRQSSSTTAYRRLTDLASQRLFAPPSSTHPPRFNHKSRRADKATLYGSLAGADDDDESSSGGDSDSDDAVNRSHIPIVRRAGFAKNS